MRFKIETLTPIWTGGVYETCDRLHETGIIGSLRWWYEAMVRGLGGYACDPTSAVGANCRCPIEVNGEKLWCNVCDLFGMTGLRRRFRLEINGGKQVYLQEKKNEFINIKPAGRTRGWYSGAGVVDNLKDSNPVFPITLVIEPLTSVKETNIKDTLETLLYFTSKWVGIGAREQHGYGIYNIFHDNGSPVALEDEKVNNCLNLIAEERPTLRKFGHDTAWLDLSRFFFAKFLINNLNSNWRNSIDGKLTNTDQLNRYKEWHKNHSSTILAPSLKNQIRFHAFTGLTQVQESLFGYVRGNDKQAAHVCVSHAYLNNNNVEVRVWGWVPDNVVKQQLYTAFNTPQYWKVATGSSSVTVSCLEWRELGGIILGRCKKSCSTPCSDGKSFLRCLLS